MRGCRRGLGVVIVAVFGCSESRDVAETPVLANLAIAGGELSGQVDDAVVLLESPSGICSGTLIAPNLVLTARHCVAVVDRAEEFGCNPDGTSQGDVAVITQDYEPSEIHITLGPAMCPYESYRAKRFYSTGSQTVCRNDLAVVELERSAEGWPIMPMRLLRPTAVGERMAVVGYGHSDDVSDSRKRRRRDGLTVMAVGSNRFEDRGGRAVAGTFILSQGACNGDSGGPAIAEETGAIAGLYSILELLDCTDPSATGVFVQIAEYHELILDAFDATSNEPWLEGEDEPSSASDAGSEGCSFSRARGNLHGEWFFIGIGVSSVGLRLRRRATAKIGQKSQLTVAPL